MMPNRAPRTTALGVSSATRSSAATYGLKAGGDGSMRWGAESYTEGARLGLSPPPGRTAPDDRPDCGFASALFEQRDVGAHIRPPTQGCELGRSGYGEAAGPALAMRSRQWTPPLMTTRTPTPPPR